MNLCYFYSRKLPGLILGLAFSIPNPGIENLVPKRPSLDFKLNEVHFGPQLPQCTEQSRFKHNFEKKTKNIDYKAPIEDMFLHVEPVLTGKFCF